MSSWATLKKSKVEVIDDEYALFLDFKFKCLRYVYTSVSFFFFMNSQNDFLNDFKWSATTPCHIIWKDSYYIFQEL